tara:strand:+ start:85 stop:1014 length:930 start_codon:yes stop_codon:yes gene_type:complete
MRNDDGGGQHEGGAPHDWFVLLFLEADKPGTDFSFPERALDTLVQHMQPAPAITHVELMIPSSDESGDDLHFSTYLGASGAAWANGYGDGPNFYLNPKGNGASWRAVPVFARDAARRLRAECHKHVDTPYPAMARLLNYPFSVPPFRAFASYLDNRRGVPAHCAALSARIMQSCMPELNVPNAAPWYGPSTLYLELSRQGRMVAYAARARAEATVQSIIDTEESARALETLLRGSDHDVRELSERSALAGTELACKQCILAGVDGGAELMRTRQKELARAMLRDSWIGRPTRLARMMAATDARSSPSGA